MFNIQRLVGKGDYWYAYVPDHPNATSKGYVLYHRVLMENHMGRLLEKDEIIHHIDGDKTNDSINNLQVMSKSEHIRLHKSTGVMYVDLVCPGCDTIFSRKRKQAHLGKNQGFLTYCSRKCNGIHGRTFAGKQQEVLSEYKKCS